MATEASPIPKVQKVTFTVTNPGDVLCMHKFHKNSKNIQNKFSRKSVAEMK